MVRLFKIPGPHLGCFDWLEMDGIVLLEPSISPFLTMVEFLSFLSSPSLAHPNFKMSHLLMTNTYS